MLLGLNLFRLQRDRGFDVDKEKRASERRLKKLMEAAYEIPFYRKRFDQAGLKPSDLTKDDLRNWMDEEEGKEEYKYYFCDNTSGSSGTPTRVYYSPMEKAWNMANWIRVLMRAGYNPFTGITAGRLFRLTVPETKTSILQKFGLLRRVFINQYAPEPDVIKQINDVKPDLLYMNKT